MATTPATVVVSLDEAKANLVCRHVEFYCSDRNLRHDKYLQKIMEESEDGLVSLSLICSFGKIMRLLGLDAAVEEDSVTM